MALMGVKMSGLMIMLYSAVGCFVAIIAFIFMLAIFDCIYEDL
jgi:hypothetical protein